MAVGFKIIESNFMICKRSNIGHRKMFEDISDYYSSTTANKLHPSPADSQRLDGQTHTVLISSESEVQESLKKLI